MPECLDDYFGEGNPVRIFDAFVNELNLGVLGFEGTDPARTGRPGYHPSVLLKLYIYGYLNRIQSSRRLEREGQRNDRRLDVVANDACALAGLKHRACVGIRQ